MATETKKEEFKKYLERCGVIETLTKVLVELYEEPEKPSNALEFLKAQIGANTAPAANEEAEGDAESLKTQITDLKQQLEQLTVENENLKSKLDELQCTQEKTTENPTETAAQ